MEGSFTPFSPSHNMLINRPNTELLALLMECQPGELGEIKLARGQRADFLSSMLHYFGYHLDTVNKIQSLKILSEVF